MLGLSLSSRGSVYIGSVLLRNPVSYGPLAKPIGNDDFIVLHGRFWGQAITRRRFAAVTAVQFQAALKIRHALDENSILLLQALVLHCQLRVLFREVIDLTLQSIDFLLQDRVLSHNGHDQIDQFRFCKCRQNLKHQMVQFHAPMVS